MTILSTLVSEIADLSDAEVVLAALTDKNVRVVIYEGPQSIAAAEAAYGAEFTMTVLVGMSQTLDFLNNNGQAPMAQYLKVYFDRFTLGSGLNFADNSVRAQLDSMVSFLTQDVVDKLKDLGVIYKSRWELHTSDPEPTLEEVQAEIENVLIERHRKDWVAYVKNGILSNDGNGKSIEELKGLIMERN